MNDQSDFNLFAYAKYEMIVAYRAAAVCSWLVRVYRRPVLQAFVTRERVGAGVGRKKASGAHIFHNKEGIFVEVKKTKLIGLPGGIAAETAGLYRAPLYQFFKQRLNMFDQDAYH